MIHKALIQKINPSHLEDKQDLEEQLRELSMYIFIPHVGNDALTCSCHSTKISLRESCVTDVYVLNNLQISISIFSPSFTGHAKPTVPQKRPADHEVHKKVLYGEKPMPTSKVTRPVPQPFIKSEPAPQIVPTAPRSHVSLPTPPMSVASTSQDATVPHEDMRPAKRLKTEPKEPVLRFTVRPSVTCESRFSDFNTLQPSPGPGQSQSSVQQPTPSLTQVQVPSPQSTPPALVAPLNLPSTQEPNELRTNVCI